MGIALTTFSALSTPLRSLTRWLHHASPLKMQSAADSSTADAHPEDAARGSSHSDAGTRKPHQRPAGIPHQRPLRGNWPFTVNPQTPPTEAPTRLATTSGGVFTSSPATTRNPCGSPWSAEGSASRTAKVLRRAPASGGSGRLVIAGRMADVCAELDRMAASEAALQTC